MAKKKWQENTVVIVAIYTQEFIDFLKKTGKKPGLIKARVDGKKYNVSPGKKCCVPVRIATQMEKLPYIQSVQEIK